MQCQRPSRLVQKHDVDGNGDGDVPLGEPDPHIAARAHHLGGASTTTSLPASLSSNASHKANSTLATARGRVKFAKSVDTESAKGIASRDVAGEQEQLKNKGGEEEVGKAVQGKKSSKVIGSREVQGLEVWHIKETPGSRNTRAWRKRVQDLVPQLQTKTVTGPLSVTDGSPSHSVLLGKGAQGGDKFGCKQAESHKSVLVRTRKTSKLPIVSGEGSHDSQRGSNPANPGYPEFSQAETPDYPKIIVAGVAESIRTRVAQAEAHHILSKEQKKAESIANSDRAEERFRETLKKILPDGLAGISATALPAAGDPRDRKSQQHQRDVDELDTEKRHKAYQGASVNQEAQLAQSRDSVRVFTRHSSTRRASRTAAAKREITNNLAFQDSLALKEENSRSVQELYKANELITIAKSMRALPVDTICISLFLTDAEIKELMPELDETVLTRARKRAEGPRGERLMSRRASSTRADVIGVRRNSVINGMKAGHTLRGPVLGDATLNGEGKQPTRLAINNHASQYQTANTSSRAERLESEDPPPRRKEEKPLERNIDNVVFGDVSFKAWYPSWYPREIIGEKGHAGEGKGIVVSDLYVCNKCFAYSKSVVDWVRHTRCCNKEMPGEKIYTHGSHGVWSIWEVDGDVDTVS